MQISSSNLLLAAQQPQVQKTQAQRLQANAPGFAAVLRVAAPSANAAAPMTLEDIAASSEPRMAAAAAKSQPAGSYTAFEPPGSRLNIRV